MTEYRKPIIVAVANTLTNYQAIFDDGRGVAHAFKAKAVLEGKDGDNTVLIPFHAVKMFVTGAISSQLSTKSDAYCGEEEDTQSSDEAVHPPIMEH